MVKVKYNICCRLVTVRCDKMKLGRHCLWNCSSDCHGKAVSKVAGLLHHPAFAELQSVLTSLARSSLLP
jgi:hypothetical protein